MFKLNFFKICTILQRVRKISYCILPRLRSQEIL